MLHPVRLILVNKLFFDKAIGLNSISFREGMPPALFPTFFDGRVVHEIKIEYQHSIMDIFIALGLEVIVSILGLVIESAFTGKHSCLILYNLVDSGRCQSVHASRSVP